MWTILFIIFLVVMTIITFALLRISKLGDIQHEKNKKAAKWGNIKYDQKR
jgi:hypothetical protein